MKLFPTVPAFLLALGVALPLSAQPMILRESTGRRLTDLEKLELTPFPAADWSLLSDWANGDALNPAATDGNVVLIFTWANWNRASTQVLPMVQRLAAENEAKGLVVVGVHHNEGWEGAADAAKKAGVKFRYAHDTSNAFRSALKVDNDPDFYLVDRAGQLRYADIQTQSVPAAVGELVAETREHAAAEADRRLTEKAKRESDARLTGQIRQNFDLARLPEMVVPKQPAEAYTKAEWPERWKEFETKELRFQQYNYGGQENFKVLELPKAANGVRWFDSPPTLSGRAIVVYFWVPDVYPSWIKAQPLMDRLQKEKGRDVAVIGVVMSKVRDANNQQQATAEENEKARLKFLEMAEKARTERQYDHAIVVDPDRTVLQTIMGTNNASQEVPWPLAAIFSSDLTLRWIGPPTDSRFNTALDQVLSVDPGVQARREAEQQYIQEHGG